MPAYLVEAGRSAACVRVGDVDSMVVFAADASTAKKMAQAQFAGDADAVWNAATVTQIVAATDWLGWTFRAQLISPAGATFIDVSLTATGAAQDTIDEIGAALVTAINATAIDGAAYNSSTQVLTVAAIADNKGDHRLVFTIKPPAAQNAGDVNISDLVGAIVHQGIAGAAVTVTLPADAAVIPLVAKVMKSA